MSDLDNKNERNLTPAARVLRMHALRERLKSQTTELMVYGIVGGVSTVLALPLVEPENFARADELLGPQAIVPVVLLGVAGVIGTAGAILTEIRMSFTIRKLNRLRLSNRFN